MKFSLIPIYLSLWAALLLAGCAHPTGKSGGAAAGKPAVSVSKVGARKSFRVRTTAYTGTRNAIGKPLSHGPVISAASDWSRFPLGTRFRIRESGKVYEIDDYGSALVGTDTIDLGKRGNRLVNAWGVRWVHIDILKWGSPRRSLEVLMPRQKYRHIRPMVAALRRQTEGLPEEFHRIKM